MTITEKDKRLLRFVACCAAIAVSAQLLIRPALAKRTELRDDLDSLEAQQTEWQEKIATLSTIDRTIEESTAARTQASEPFYKGQLETREMDDIITALLLKHGLFPQSLALEPGNAGAVSDYLAPDVQTQDTESDSADTSDSSTTDSADTSDSSTTDSASTDSAPEASAPRYIHIGKASLEATGKTEDWLAFLDEMERTFGGLRVTDFTVAESHVIENNVTAVTTNTIDAAIDLYMCIPEEAGA